jgi:hypothetical protein
MEVDVSELNPRHRAFIDAYLTTANGNGTRAAITAGYSEKTAGVQASQLLKHPAVRAAIEAKLLKHDIRTDAILKRFGKIVHSEPESAPTHQDIIAAGKVILQVHGALQAKPQQSTGVTVNIGFLQAPHAHELPAITISSTVKELTQGSQGMTRQAHLVPGDT